jgi:hypothetical protein
MRALHLAKILPFALTVSAILVAGEDTVAPEPRPEATLAQPDGLDVAMARTPMSPAPARFDQVQKKADPSRPLAIYPIGQGQNLAQTFTAGTTGDLAYVWLPVACAAGSLVKIRIQQAGGIIASDYNYDPAHTIQDGTFLQFQIYPYVPLTPGRRYVILLSSVAATKLAARPSCSIASGPAGDSYAGGGAFYEDVPTNGPGWLPLPNAPNQGDLPFATMVW